MGDGEASRTRRSAWRFLGWLIGTQRKGVLLLVLAGLSWQGAAIFTPVVAAHAVDAIVAGNRPGLYWWVAAVVLIGAIEATAGGLRHIFAMRNRAHGYDVMRGTLLRQALRMDARYHDRFPPGELMSRASSDAEVAGRVLDAIGHTVGYVLTVIGASIVLLVLDWELALMILAPLPILSVGFWRYSRRYKAGTTAVQDELGRATALVEETVTGIRVVKGLGAGEALSARFRRTSDNVFERAMAVARLDAMFLPALELLPMVDLLIVLWFGGNRVIDGELTLGEFVAFNAYVVLLVWPMRVLGQRISTVQNALAAAERIVDALDVDPEVREADDPRALPAGGADVRFENVTFGYSASSPVLDGFSLHVEPGASVALVGRTGSGKSTVAALLSRFYDVQDGRVLLDGIDVRELSLVEVRHAVALVAEDTYLFTNTVRENIKFGRAYASDAEVEAAARAAGAHEFVERLPDGYDTMLGERGYTLSGGQRQRVAIARAILADPAVLVLDDATSSVDATKEHEIRAALAVVMEGRTTIVIAHRPATIALAERVVVLEDGRVVEEGTHESLAASSARYRALLALDEDAQP
jgi:ATP-binding cassette subfamily B protein